MSILTRFFNGLKKSFDGKDYLREINKCEICYEPSYTNICGYCRTKSHYKISEERYKKISNDSS